MKKTIRQTVEETIRDHRLIVPGDRIVLGLSGGADSMALTYLLHYLSRKMDFSLYLAHLNHLLRGTDADEEEEFARQTARVLGLPFISTSVDVGSMARTAGVSVEMAARKARHDFFLEALNRFDADSVALAHTANDQAETMMLRLVRGTGTSGLAAMRHNNIVNAIPIIRPLLDVSRQEVVAFLRTHGLQWREDSSNQSTAHQRNLVRNEILPLLARHFNPRIHEALCHTAAILSAEDEWMTRLTDELTVTCCSELALKTCETGRLHPALQRRLLMRWLDINEYPAQRRNYALIEQLRDLIKEPAGTRHLSLGYGLQAVRRYNLMMIEPATTGGDWPPVAVTIPGRTEIAAAGCSLTVKLCRGYRTESNALPQCAASAFIDAGKCHGHQVIARPWRAGDRMQPFGFKGHRKLQDVFTDHKIPRDQRHRIPVFTCGEEIIWVPGWRVAADWAVRSPGAASLHFQLFRCP